MFYWHTPQIPDQMLEKLKTVQKRRRDFKSSLPE